MSSTPAPAFPRPSPRYDAMNEAQFRASVEGAVEGLAAQIRDEREAVLNAPLYNNGSLSGAVTIDWSLGLNQALTMSGAVVATVDDATLRAGGHILQVKNASGGALTLTLAGVDHWATATPTASVPNNTTTVLRFTGVEAYNGSGLRVVGETLVDVVAL